MADFSDCYTHKPMKTKEIRRRRLDMLIDEDYAGKQALFAAAVGKTPSQISQIMTGHRGLGEDLAREIERATGKPRGWLDGVDDPLSLLEADERHLIEQYRHADRRGRELILNLCESQARYSMED